MRTVAILGMAWSCEPFPVAGALRLAPSSPGNPAPTLDTNEPRVDPVQMGKAAGGDIFARMWTDPVGGGKAPVAAPMDADPNAAGKKVYLGLCATCHQPSAKGIPGAFPPLAGSDYLMADKRRSIAIVLHGLVGPVVVNGLTFTNAMPPQPQLTDEQISAVLSFVRSNFGNRGAPVTPQEVAAGRSGHPE